MRASVRKLMCVFTVALFWGTGNITAQEKIPSREQTASREELLAAIAELKQLVLAQGRELREQRAVLHAQHEQLARMESALLRLAPGAAPQLTSAAQPDTLAGPDSVPLADNRESTPPDAAQRIDSGSSQVLEGIRKALGNFQFSGDLRLRGETFHGGTLPVSRVRDRFRLRFNVDAKFGEEWSGGFRLASGDVTDPTTTNQTFTSFFNRKPIAIDRAFLTYRPKWFKPLSLTGGKFAFTWYLTEIALDTDLNPEGFSQVLDFHVNKGILERVGFVGFQSPFNERSSGRDSLLLGGQVQLGFRPAGRFKLSTYAGFMDFLRTDAVRAAQTASPVQLTGTANSNAATATQFASRFGIFDVIARVDVNTGAERWPLMFQFDYATNTRACTNLVNIPAPRPACNPRDRDAYWAEVQFGQARRPRDLQFGYTFLRIEQEAVLGAFNFSDLRSPTGIFTHRVNAGYQLYDRITLNWTGLFGRRLVTAATPAREAILKRMQFDVIYKY